MAERVSERHFLAVRDRDHRLVRIEIFDDPVEALDRYATIEGEQFMDPHEPDCCLFGADSLATLCRTHASWFAPETLDLESLLPTQPTRPEGEGNG